MAEPKTTGTLTTVDDRPALRFERHLPCSVDRVWRAISQPAELLRWFPSPIVWTPALGEAFNIDGEIGEVVELRSPTLLGWTAGRERFHVEVLSARDGSLLEFTHVYDERFGSTAQHASGWEAYLDRLDAHLAGGFLSEEDAHDVVPALHERYAARFGEH